MDDLVYRRFSVSGKLEDCLQVPPDPTKDVCKVQLEDQDKMTFVVERHGDKFQVSATDAPKVAKAYPSFKPPIQELKDYILLKKEVAAVFGESAHPTTITAKIQVLTVEDVFKTIETTLNFVSHGSLSPANGASKTMMEEAIKNFIATFADPVLGILLDKMLRSVQSDPNLGAESKKRIGFLLMTNQARERFWEAMKPEMEKSLTLGDALKGTSQDIITFLFANHILADKGYEKTLFSDNIKSAVVTHREVMSKVDADYSASANFYAYLVKVLSQLKKTAKVPEEYRVEFERRIDVAVFEYQKESKAEMFRMMDQAPAEKSCKDYLLFQYGDTPMRREALNLMLKSVTVVSENDAPRFLIPMEKISGELQNWAQAQASPEKQKEAIEAVNYLLKNLFERGGKMKVYWNKQVMEIENFYTRGDFPLVGPNKSALEKLIRWAREEAKGAGLNLSPDAEPRYSMRKFTLITELGIGGVGMGTYFGLGALKEGETQYFARGGAIITGGIGLGMATGNLVSYLLGKNGNSFWWDVGGGLLGGALAGVLYFSTASKPKDHSGGECIGNCTKFPTDEYGKSFGFSFAQGF